MKKRSLLVILFMSILLFSLTSCGSESKKPSNEVQEPAVEQTAYEKLNDDEKKLFDAFKGNVEDFYDPASVKLTKIEEEYWGGKAYKIRVSGSNSSGSQNQRQYLLVVESGNYTAEMITEYSIAFVNGYGQFVGAGESFYVSAGSLGDIDYMVDNYHGALSDDFTRVVVCLCNFQKVKDEITATLSISKINAALDDYKVEIGY